jgi:hypothetical protein
MNHRLRETLLVRCADLGEALVVQSFLEGAGIPCRLGVDDRAPVRCDVTRNDGPLAPRPVGLWVLEADVARAHSVLATMGPATAAGGLDAEATSTAGPSHPAAPAPLANRRAGWVAPTLVAMVLLVAALLAVRG